jgi:hypothetical protein
MTAAAMDDKSVHPSQTMRTYLNYLLDEHGRPTDTPFGYEMSKDTLDGIGMRIEEIRLKHLNRPGGLPPLAYAQVVRRVIVGEGRKRIAKLLGT